MANTSTSKRRRVKVNGDEWKRKKELERNRYTVYDPIKDETIRDQLAVNHEDEAGFEVHLPILDASVSNPLRRAVVGIIEYDGYDHDVPEFI